jgi:outer membrane protein TolC
MIPMLYGDSIKHLIDHALRSHPSLKSIEHRLSAMDDKIARSKNWSNPEMILNLNDIHFDDLSNRGLEPMQYQAVQFKQRFPWFGKTEARERFTRAQKNVVFDSYEAARVKLSEAVRTTAYTILEIKERLRIVDAYEKLTQQNIALYEAYSATDSKSHSNSMSAQLMLSRLNIRHTRYRAVLQSQKAKLAYLVQSKYPAVSGSLKISSPEPLSYYLSRIDNNPGYKRMLAQNNVADANRHIKELEKMPDPFLQVGYFNRQEYEDYASISVGFALPVYGSEKLETESARKALLSAQSASLDYRMALESDIRVSYAKMQEAYRVYRIIHDESMPRLQHMFELNEASIESGEDLFTYTSLLEQKLELEEEQTVAKAAYLKTLVKLNALTGKI